MAQRPDFIKHVSELPSRERTWPGSDEILSIRTSLSRPLGLVRLGVHYEVLQPGHRTSLPHAERSEEECVYVLRGFPHAWIDGRLYPMKPDDIVVFPPGTRIRHTIVNQTDGEVQLLVVGERAPLRHERFREFLGWLTNLHPEVADPKALSESRLLELADEFEAGGISERWRLREHWRVAFASFLFDRGADTRSEGTR